MNREPEKWSGLDVMLYAGAFLLGLATLLMIWASLISLMGGGFLPDQREVATAIRDLTEKLMTEKLTEVDFSVINEGGQTINGDHLCR